MMDYGRDFSPDVSGTTSSGATGVGTKVPLSTQSPYCPYHSESTAGGTFQFPPREQPTHAVRRAIIAAIQVVKEQNEGIPADVGDRVSIVTFDAVDSNHEPKLLVPLTSDYTAAMQACTTMQAVGDLVYSTSTENGLIKAQAHLKPVDEGGQGRINASRVYILLTDGIPNIYQSSSSSVSNYMSSHPDSDFYPSSDMSYNTVLMQSSIIQSNKGHLYGVGMGLGADYDFMDRIDRIANTDVNGASPRGSGNPAQYEQRLIDIFKTIIQTPGMRLVK
jgi:hypothetical protein